MEHGNPCTGAAFGWRCHEHPTGLRRFPIDAGALSAFNLPCFDSSAVDFQMPYLRYITHGKKTKAEAAMKSPTAALLALALVPVQATLGQESTWDKLTRLSPGTKIEVEDAHSGTIQGQLVSVDEQALTLRRKGKESRVVETIVRADVVRVAVKHPSAKKILILGIVGAGIGALGGGSRCKGPTVTTTYGSYCQDPNGYYFDKTGGKIGAGAGAALGLLGFVFPSKKIWYERSLLGKSNDSYSSITGANSDAAKESSLQLQSFGRSTGDNDSKSQGAVPVKADCGNKFSEKGDCHAVQE